MPEIKSMDDVRAENASNLLKLTIDMNKQKVLSIMGAETIQTGPPFVKPD